MATSDRMQKAEVVASVTLIPKSAAPAQRSDLEERLVDRLETLISQLPPCIQWHPDGEIRLVGHRIGLYHFVYHYNQGFRPKCSSVSFRPWSSRSSTE